MKKFLIAAAGAASVAALAAPAIAQHAGHSSGAVDEAHIRDTAMFNKKHGEGLQGRSITPRARMIARVISSAIRQKRSLSSMSART